MIASIGRSGKASCRRFTSARIECGLWFGIMCFHAEYAESRERREEGVCLLRRHIVCDSMDSVLHQDLTEVEEQAESEPRKFEIRPHLFVMHLRQRIQRFDFEDDFVFDDKVCPKTGT